MNHLFKLMSILIKLVACFLLGVAAWIPVLNLYY